MRAPVNSFEFHPCGHTPQAAHLTRSLRHPGSCPDTQCASFTARTTRVSNPVRSPRLRASASAVRSQPAFAIGVLPDIYRFHPYTWNSGCATAAQAQQFPARFRGWAPGFHARLAGPPTRPLRPMIPNNARALRVTAAAGTELAGAYSRATVTGKAFPPPLIPRAQKGFTTFRPSSPTRRRSVRVPPIAEYS